MMGKNLHAGFQSRRLLNTFGIKNQFNFTRFQHDPYPKEKVVNTTICFDISVLSIEQVSASTDLSSRHAVPHQIRINGLLEA